MGFAVRFAWGIVGRPRERRFPMKFILCALCLVAMLGPVANLHAQVNPYKEGTPGVTGYRSEVLAEVTIQEDKFLRLAEAIPADKFNWRPAPDVRSFADRKSTRLNSSHLGISYAVFCLKKNKS